MQNLKYEESYQNYRCACGFTFSLSSFPDEFDFELIRKHGWYDPKKNPNGVSRDHLYSVNAGFKNKVPSLLLGHPANCKLVLHKKNQSKGASCSITLTELKERISQWEKNTESIFLIYGQTLISRLHYSAVVQPGRTPDC